MASSYSASNIITCSSAAGTALSTGFKTNNGFLGVAPDSTDLESIAYKIHDAGFKVGVMSTVSLDHATPGAFYANSVKRSDYYSIAVQMADSDFEFFGGGGFIDPKGKKGDQRSAYDIIGEEGYVIAAGMDEFQTKKGSAEKMLLLQAAGVESHELPYAIDRGEDDMKLCDLITSAIGFLEGEDGFFMMAEAGRIDWAAHSNDAKTAILETLDLADAVEVAYQFYLKHPDQTLIVVTADHETGGMALAYKGGYHMYFDKLDVQKTSKDNTVSATSYEAGTGNAKEDIDNLNKEARFGWTSSSHSAANVPVFAIGVGSEKFAGKMDNTDIPKKICSAMGVEF
jgi:alkaline phosphatase